MNAVRIGVYYFASRFGMKKEMAFLLYSSEVECPNVGLSSQWIWLTKNLESHPFVDVIRLDFNELLITKLIVFTIDYSIFIGHHGKRNYAIVSLALSRLIEHLSLSCHVNISQFFILHSMKFDDFWYTRYQVPGTSTTIKVHQFRYAYWSFSD
jgi:hypothetical protein